MARSAARIWLVLTIGLSNTPLLLEAFMAEWQLRFPAKHIVGLARRYEYEGEEEVLKIGRRAQAAGKFAFKDFLAACEWKTSRTRSRCRKNSPEEVAEATRIALSTRVETLRIGVLQCLEGVGLPTASVLLHIAHRDPYPILDFRALWSLGFEKPPTYNFTFWWKYVEVCRRLARKHGVDMRTLDRALWQYSKDHQA